MTLMGAEVRLNTYSDSVGTAGDLAFNPRTPAAFQRHDPTPQRGPETHSSTPIGYPFKLKAAAASPAVAGGCAAPVVCGPAVGADAPKLVPSDSELCERPIGIWNGTGSDFAATGADFSSLALFSTAEHNPSAGAALLRAHGNWPPTDLARPCHLRSLLVNWSSIHGQSYHAHGVLKGFDQPLAAGPNQVAGLLACPTQTWGAFENANESGLRLVGA
jgi:hypothetical protein